MMVAQQRSEQSDLDLRAWVRSTLRSVDFRREVPSWEEQGQIPLSVFKLLGDGGLMGLLVPKVYGGAGLGCQAFAVVAEELGRLDGSLGLSVGAHNSLCIGHLLQAGTPDQQARYLPALARGDRLGAWALTEPGAGSDAGGVATTATRTAQGWILHGRKMFVTHGSTAGLLVVLARTSSDPAAQAGSALTAFIVERDLAPGLKVVRSLDKLGMRASDTAELELDHLVVPDTNRLGEVGAAFKDAMAILDRGRIGLAALAVGIGAGALEDALKYAQERRQFGAPVARFQGVQWVLADGATELEAARSLIGRAASLADQGLPFTKLAAMAKLFSSEAASRATDGALQVHGGYGYLKDHLVERRWRDVRLCEIGEGTSQVLRMVIARQLMVEQRNVSFE